MVKEATSKINRVGPRHTIYLQKDLVEDTNFPFLLNEPLTVRVDGERLIIERAGGRSSVESDFLVESLEATAILPILENLGFSQVLSKAEKIYEMLTEIHEAEMLELRVRLMPPREHAILLYRNRGFLNSVVTEFFDPGSTGSAPMGFLSEKPKEEKSVTNVLYGEILGKGKTRVSESILDWMSRLHTSNTTSGTTRIAIEDFSWFIENGFEGEVLKCERGIAALTKGNATVLCCYDLSRLDEPQIGKMTSLHSYAILDTPFRIYRKTKS